MLTDSEIQQLRNEGHDAVADEIERLRDLSVCECGDGFMEHDKGLCVNCASVLTAPYSVKIAELEAEVDAWRSRFTEYKFRPQDGCVALK